MVTYYDYTDLIINLFGGSEHTTATKNMDNKKYTTLKHDKERRR